MSVGPSPTADPDVEAVRRIPAVSSILQLLRLITGMEVIAVARVTQTRWLACAALDDSPFGLRAGSELPVETTICQEVRREARPVAVDDCQLDPRYRDHPFFRTYGFRSYLAQAIVLSNGDCWGTLCAMGFSPADVSNDKTIALFRHFAEQIAAELDIRSELQARGQELDLERFDGERREQFIATLGHDQRNPLSSISAAANVLKIKSTDAALVDKLASRILTNVDRMAAMVDDLYDLARGRLGGGVQAELAPIDDLAESLEQVVDELRAAHPDRDVQSGFRIDRPVAGDRGRLQQLLSNLVGNALSHGDPQSPVEIDGRIDGANLVISVRNDGTPIPKDSIPGLFDAFTRHDPATRRGHDGLGLGLYICSQIARAHGGQVTATSSSEDGTLFTVEIPIRQG